MLKWSISQDGQLSRCIQGSKSSSPPTSPLDSTDSSHFTGTYLATAPAIPSTTTSSVSGTRHAETPNHVRSKSATLTVSVSRPAAAVTGTKTTSRQGQGRHAHYPSSPPSYVDYNAPAPAKSCLKDTSKRGAARTVAAAPNSAVVAHQRRHRYTSELSFPRHATTNSCDVTGGDMPSVVAALGTRGYTHHPAAMARGAAGGVTPPGVVHVKSSSEPVRLNSMVSVTCILYVTCIL